MADGKSYAEAVKNAEVVIAEWLETARILGRAIPVPRGRPAYARRLRFRISDFRFQISDFGLSQIYVA